MHLKAFLQNRDIPSSAIDAIFNTPLAPKKLFDAIFSVHVNGEKIGMNLNWHTEHDLSGARTGFLSFISE